MATRDLPDDAYPQGEQLINVLRTERVARVEERDRAQARIDAIDEQLASLGEPETRCPLCGGLNGAHGLVHTRYGNGGGGNKPCPTTPPTVTEKG